MSFFADFLRQKAPKRGAEAPAYYQKALSAFETIMAGYFAAALALTSWAAGGFQWVPALMFAVTLLYFIGRSRIRMFLHFPLCALICVVWMIWYVPMIGWGTGSQHFLLALLLFSFFNIFIPPWVKVLICGVLLAFRYSLYAFSLAHPALIDINAAASIVLQILNSTTVFIQISICCILFSSSIQNTERELRINNQLLHREAGTDPLTGMYNRRAMLDAIDLYQKEHPMEPFSVAIADLDLFKNVNDTYGHSCGDYTLRQIAALFLERADTDYTVCRWGGEEFCFLLPGKNIDEARVVMMEVNHAVHQLPLSYEGHSFSVTVTIGVEENDFRSPVQAILEKADEKLYMGKKKGRNCVVA